MFFSPQYFNFVTFSNTCLCLYINHQLDALIIIYSSNTILLYMFRASSAHLQEDIFVCRPVFRYFTPLGPRNFCAPPNLFVFSYVQLSFHKYGPGCMQAAYGTATFYKSPGGLYRQATRTLIESDGTICCLHTTISSCGWAFDARNM